MSTISDNNERTLYVMLLGFLLMTSLSALLYQGPSEAFAGFLRIQQHPARLINDFTHVGGVGAALLNASAVAGISLFLTWAVGGVQLSGPTIAAFFTLFGFGLFGKTPLNILPVLAGVWIASKAAGKTYQEYILIALFGTALGPLASFFALEMGFAGPLGIAVGASAGLLAGILLPAAAMAMLHLHQGYNLYNMGLTCGFIGLFAAGIIKTSHGDLTIRVVWLSEPDPLLRLFIPALSLYLSVFGMVMAKKAVWNDFLSIQKMSGRLPSDFMDRVSRGGALLNTGILGLLSWLYVYGVGGDFNGPVIGGILTVMGFGVFGKHVKNTIPVVIGVVLSCLIFGKPLSSPGPILAALFATTLAPIAGEFGALMGMAAGFVHLIMVEQTASWHGGIDLYNNGFAGGLTAALFFAVIEWYRNSRPDPYELEQRKREKALRKEKKQQNRGKFRKKRYILFRSDKQKGKQTDKQAGSGGEKQ